MIGLRNPTLCDDRAARGRVGFVIDGVVFARSSADGPLSTSVSHHQDARAQKFSLGGTTRRSHALLQHLPCD
ncbi:hypothetical protein CBOM_07509 [Ceraceosorus bombacis]|uniref:Uncharacterized protein n=1 Tax=Ceraceosorus bombacis TaxID=401625 RepID=A0A0N7L9M3_9BASI|nr:hypothetical protein CBOM_07509 [Ceraceosorus bombacis]